MNYLTEIELGKILNNIYNEEFIHDKCIDNFHKFRPDYRSEKQKIIVEFNGYRHYSSSTVIMNDYKKYKILEDLGYKVIIIPYFVQISTLIIKQLFNIEYKYIQQYLHGFIDDKALLPADFCYLGIQRFEKDLIDFNIISNDIILSIKNKILQSNNRYIVLPENLFYLIK